MKQIRITDNDREEKRKVSVVDRRRINAEGEMSDAAEPSLKPSYVEQMEEKVRAAEARLRERLEQLEEEARRSRERVAADLELRSEEKEKSMLLDVLEILDDLDRASGYAKESPSVLKGFELIKNRIRLFLEKHECERVLPHGEPFDPETMEALQMAPGPKDRVASVMSSGIIRKGNLLRPARVAVGDGRDTGSS